MNPITMQLVADKYIKMALEEDINSEDVSTNAVMPEYKKGDVQLICKEDGIIAGLQIFERVFTLLDEKTQVEFFVKDGEKVKKGQTLAVVTGDIRVLLSGERTALNYLQRLSGIATYTHSVAKLLEGSKTKLLDTRKTTPGMRIFEKYAVRIGGGCNHRYNLSDGVLLKDNHIDAAGGVKEAVAAAKAYAPFVRKIEVETENLDMVKEAVEAGADIIMLDNMTPEQMDKNVAKTWAEFELLSDNSEVDLRMDPVTTQPAKKNILSYLLPRSGGEANKRLKVGFIYENTPQTSEWCYAHELGRRYIDETFASQIETVSITNVRPEEDDYNAIQRLIDDNTDLIFVTSPSMMYASLKQAIAHPKAKILNCSLNISHKYIRTYYARMYEAKYLTGVIAGVMAKSDKIGYVASCPLYGVMANVNAFAMGARAVNPDVKVYVEWSGIKDNDIEARFAEQGINCISDQDMITPKKTSRKFGLYVTDSGMVKHLAMPVWHWGVFYEKLIQSILSGSWKKEEEGDKVSALNYWWGMSAGAIDIIYGGAVPDETKKVTSLIREAIVKGEFKPFTGELKDQDGKVRNKPDEELDPDEIIEMDWLLDNVVGRVPEYEELDDNSKMLVINQGIIDVND